MLVCLKTFRSGTISAICTLPITVLGGSQTSQVDKFLNTIPTHQEPGQRSLEVLVAMNPHITQWLAIGSEITCT